MDDLIRSISSLEIKKITGESQETIKRWKKGTKKIPESARRLLKLYVTGDATTFLGKDWSGQTRDSAKNDIQAYIAYYNAHRIHTAIGNMSPIEFEKNLNKVSGFI